MLSGTIDYDHRFRPLAVVIDVPGSEEYQAIQQAEQFPTRFRFGDDFPIAQRE